jgi:hypothetical protein
MVALITASTDVNISLHSCTVSAIAREK